MPAKPTDIPSQPDDASKYLRVELYVGSTFLNRQTDPPYKCDWDTRTVPDGRYLIRAEAYAPGGSVPIGSRSVSVTVDNTPDNTPDDPIVVPPPPPLVSPSPSLPSPPPPPDEGRTVAVQRIGASVSNRWRVYRRYTQILELEAQDVPAGARVHVRCRGRGCPFRTRTRFAGQETREVVLHRFFGRSRLRPGAVVEVWITRPGAIGKVTRYSVRRNARLPRRQILCVSPGAARPRAC